MERETVLEAKGIYKSFPGVKALSDVTFDLRKGEVHVLLGENGAGKSTLMKIISGLYSIDEGELYVNGQRARIHNTMDSQKLGIAIIYQEFSLIPHISVARNIFLNREPRTKNGNIDRTKMRSEARKLLSSINADVSEDALVCDLGVAQQQMVEVAKALSQNARILILDEPTATLSEREIDKLFSTIRSLRDGGVSMIYISHRLQEIKQIGDRVTVLRDGMTVGTHDLTDVELDELISMMVGRKITGRRARLENTATDQMALEAIHIQSGKVLHNVSVNVRKGEIVAIAGLVGAGRTELMHAIFGIDKFDSGEVRVMGKKINKPSPSRMIRSGVGLLPESRKECGLSLILPIFQNISMAALGRMASAGVLNLLREKRAARDSVKELNIATPGIGQLVMNLSGGNQQKVVLAKWLTTQSRILIFDEPTRGIDVGAREEIYQIMNRLASEGESLLVVSSDLPEVLTIADRVYVMRMGSIVAELDAGETSQEEIISYATGGRGANEAG
ncbi:MAG: sugar ABC transporter ATP-binding protein [Candidatus Excrementavichristensenella sp.]|jgi:ABC-type sugar transport system ATPase subunit